MDRAPHTSSASSPPDPQAAADQSRAAIDAAPTLVLLDGHALFHRSFHAFPEEMSTTAGEPTNAIFGFTRMVLDVLKLHQSGVSRADLRPAHADLSPQRVCAV